MSRLLGWVVLLALVACGHAPVRATQVVVAEQVPGESCERIGEVEGRAATGPLSLREATREAERALQDAAARRGATHVHLNRREEPGMTTVVLGGTAYRCDI